MLPIFHPIPNQNTPISGYKSTHPDHNFLQSFLGWCCFIEICCFLGKIQGPFIVCCKGSPFGFGFVSEVFWVIFSTLLAQMAASQNQLIEQLKDVGNRVLRPPSSTPELLKLLDELELLLSKVGQSPPQQVQEALLSSMKALIADDLLRHADADVKVTVAACLNEVMRVSAPVAPYDDEKMKEIFELIVLSFDKLSSLTGRCYFKAVLMLESVAKLRSCVMMLDIDCDPLIVKMFELFQKNISSNHPQSVFQAMKTIMSVVIEESDSVSPELLNVLLASIRKENQDASPTSWKLGVQVIEQCAEKLRPFISAIVKSLGCCLEDYAPILSSVCTNEPDTLKNHVHDSPMQAVKKEPLADKSPAAEHIHSPKAIERCTQNAVVKAEFTASADPGPVSGSTASKREKKRNSHNHDEENENLSKEANATLGSPHRSLKKSPLAPKGEEKTLPALEDMDSKGVKKEVADLEHQQLHQASSLGDSSKKKGRLPKKDASGGSGKKSTTAPSKKNSQINDAPKSQRKRPSVDDDDDDEVFETPHGRKNYKEDLVGCKIKVWWPLDRRFYEGTITSFEASTKKHRVDYDDGDEEILNLRKERWEFVGDESVADLDLLTVKKTPKTASDVKKREGSTEGEKKASQKEVMLDSGAESDEGKHPKTVADSQKSKTPKVGSETKRPKLSDSQKS